MLPKQFLKKFDGVLRFFGLSSQHEVGGALVHVENIRRWPGVCAGTIGGFLVAIATVMIFSGGYL